MPDGPGRAGIGAGGHESTSQHRVTQQGLGDQHQRRPARPPCWAPVRTALPKANWFMLSGAPVGKPPEYQLVNASSSALVPSVATSGVTWKRVTAMPATRPATATTANARRMPCDDLVVPNVGRLGERDCGGRDGARHGQVEASLHDDHRLAERGDGEDGEERQHRVDGAGRQGVGVQQEADREQGDRAQPDAAEARQGQRPHARTFVSRAVE